MDFTNSSITIKRKIELLYDNYFIFDEATKEAILILAEQIDIIKEFAVFE